MTELTKQVAAGADDGYDFGTTFVNNQTSTYIGNDGANQIRSFHRFTSVGIPVGATILAAKLQFRATISRSGTTCNLKVHFEAADNPSAPSSHADLVGRSLTTGTAWSSVGAWTTDTWYDSVDVTSELQAVIDRAGWTENNAITAHVLNDGSSTNAYRQAKTYESAAASAAKLVVTYTAPASVDLFDASGAGDSADSFSLTDSLSDSAEAGDAVEGYDFKGIIDDAAGAGDSAVALAEADGAVIDAAGISDIASGDNEAQAPLADSAGLSDESDGFSWTAWQTSNRHRAVIRYYCTVTGAADDEDDIEVPISSFSARKRTGDSNYLSVVVPGYAYANQISARPNGELVIEMAYVVDGVESLREEIIRVDIENIIPQIGPRSRSITLIGHKTAPSYDARNASIQGCNYKYSYDGSLGFRFPQADPYLNPGDALTVVDTDDEVTVGSITYSISAGGYKFMEVREG